MGFPKQKATWMCSLMHDAFILINDWWICCLLVCPHLWKRMLFHHNIMTLSLLLSLWLRFISFGWINNTRQYFQCSLVLFFLNVKCQALSGKIVMWQYFRFLSTSSCHWPICGSFLGQEVVLTSTRSSALWEGQLRNVQRMGLDRYPFSAVRGLCS